MAGMLPPGYRSPASPFVAPGATGPGSAPPPGVGQPPITTPAPAEGGQFVPTFNPVTGKYSTPGPVSGYHSDAGQYMTGDEYQNWLRRQSGASQQQSTDIQTRAQQGLMTAQEGLAEKQASAEAGLQATAEQRRFGMFQPYLDRFSGAIIGGAGSPQASAIGAPAQVQLPDVAGLQSPAQQAAFARAKDQAGLIGRSAVTALQGAAAGRGLGSSSLATGDIARAIGTGATQLGDLNREQAIQALNLARQQASEAYQGGIAQRAQDIGLGEAGLQAAVAQRGQNLSALMGLIGSFPGQITARY